MNIIESRNSQLLASVRAPSKMSQSTFNLNKLVKIDMLKVIKKTESRKGEDVHMKITVYSS